MANLIAAGCRIKIFRKMMTSADKRDEQNEADSPALDIDIATDRQGSSLRR